MSDTGVLRNADEVKGCKTCNAVSKVFLVISEANPIHSENSFRLRYEPTNSQSHTNALELSYLLSQYLAICIQSQHTVVHACNSWQSYDGVASRETAASIVNATKGVCTRNYESKFKLKSMWLHRGRIWDLFASSWTMSHQFCPSVSILRVYFTLLMFDQI